MTAEDMGADRTDQSEEEREHGCSGGCSSEHQNLRELVKGQQDGREQCHDNQGEGRSRRGLFTVQTPAERQAKRRAERGHRIWQLAS